MAVERLERAIGQRDAVPPFAYRHGVEAQALLDPLNGDVTQFDQVHEDDSHNKPQDDFYILPNAPLSAQSADWVLQRVGIRIPGHSHTHLDGPN